MGNATVVSRMPRLIARTTLAVVLLAAAGSFSSIPLPQAPVIDHVPSADTVQLQRSFSRLPLSFESNRGQLDSQVQFLARGPGYKVFLTPTEAVLALRSEKSETGEKHGAKEQLKRGEMSVLRMKVLGANREARASGLEPLPGIANYFIGNDPAKWRTNIPTYAQVQYKDVYPGIDLVYYGTNQRQFEYDFVVAPGADPTQIALTFEGAESVASKSNGDLVLRPKGTVPYNAQCPVPSACAGSLHFKKPVVYQMVNGVRRDIAGSYVLRTRERREARDRRDVQEEEQPPFSSGVSRLSRASRTEVGFALAAYDPAYPLIIDPVLTYSTYLGGNGDDKGFAVAMDGSGNAYVTGTTSSTNLTTTPGAYDLSCGTNGSCDSHTDAFVVKLNAAGSARLYATYVGGENDDSAAGIAIDAGGNAYVTGETFSTTFPTIPADSTNYTLGGDAFILKLNSSGTALLYSRYLGGTDFDRGNAVAVDAAGNAYVVGQTFSGDFPIVNAFQGIHAGAFDAFVTKVNPTGSALIYSTYLGGTSGDIGHGIAVDQLGNAYVAGDTDSTDFPTLNPAQPLHGGFTDAFLAKLTKQGAALVYSTFLGGIDLEEGQSVAIDAVGQAYLTGRTASAFDFPKVNPLQFNYGGGNDDVFIARLNAAGTAFDFSTYLGGQDYDEAYGLGLDGAGHAYVAGQSASTDFPVQAGQSIPGGGDAFGLKLHPTGTALVYSTALGAGSALVHGLAIDPAGSAVVTGEHSGITALTAVNAIQPAFGGGDNDGFVTKIASSCGTSAVADLTLTQGSNPSTFTVGTSSSLAYNLTVVNHGPSAATGVTVVDRLPDGLTFTSAIPSQGSCSTSAGTVTCQLGTIPNSAGATVTVNVANPGADGSFTNRTIVRSAECDAAPADNNAAATTTVTGGVNVATLTVAKKRQVDNVTNPPSLSDGLVTSVNVAGIVCGSDCTETYPTGTVVYLYVTPQPNPNNPSRSWFFLGWEGGGCSGTGPCTVVVTSDTVVTARFGAQQSSDFGGSLGEIVPIGESRVQTLFADMGNPTPASAVTVGISAASPFSIVGPGTFTLGSNQTLQNGSPPNNGVKIRFAPQAAAAVIQPVSFLWKDALNSVLYGGALSMPLVGVGIEDTRPLLSVTLSGNGQVTQTDPPFTGQIDPGTKIRDVGINCPTGTCARHFDDFTQVTLTASANAGAIFKGWSGAGCSGLGTCQVTMDQTKSVRATFQTVPVKPPRPSRTPPGQQSFLGSVTDSAQSTQPNIAAVASQLRNALQNISPDAGSSSQPAGSSTPSKITRDTESAPTSSGTRSASPSGRIASAIPPNACPIPGYENVPVETAEAALSNGGETFIRLVPVQTTAYAPFRVIEAYSPFNTERVRCIGVVLNVAVSPGTNYFSVGFGLLRNRPEAVLGTVNSINIPGIHCPPVCSWLYPSGTVVASQASSVPNVFHGQFDRFNCGTGDVKGILQLVMNTDYGCVAYFGDCNGCQSEDSSARFGAGVLAGRSYVRRFYGQMPSPFTQPVSVTFSLDPPPPPLGSGIFSIVGNNTFVVQPNQTLGDNAAPDNALTLQFSPPPSLAGDAVVKIWTHWVPQCQGQPGCPAPYDVSVDFRGITTTEPTPGPPQAWIVTTQPSATEAGQVPAQIVVTRTEDISSSAVLNYNLSGTAASGSDYQSLPSQLTIPAGQAQATINITPINDCEIEPNETVTLTLQSGTTGAFPVSIFPSPANSATATIISDDNNVVTITATDNVATEAGLTTGTFRIERTGPTTSPLTVSFSVGESTATNGIDYQSLGQSATIPSGQTFVTLTVMPINDNLGEDDETVVVRLTSGCGYTVGDSSAATVTIVSDDLPLVSITATDANAAEAGPDPGLFTITRTAPTTAALTVSFQIFGSATAGSDYQSLGTSVTIPAGQTSATLTVTPINDSTPENNETVGVQLVDGPGYFGNSNSAIVTISDNDLPVVTLTTADNTATEAGPTTGTFTVTRTLPTADALTVAFSVAGTATSGSDYQGLGSSVIIPAGQTTATLVVTPIDDATIEDDETVTVTLTSAVAYTLGTPNTGTVTIVDNDRVVTIAATDDTATEAGPTAGTFTVSRTGPTTSALTVSLFIGGTATPGSDYQSLPTSVAIPAGQASATLTLTPINDTAAELDETVTVTLGASNAYTIGVPGSATITIVSDDLPTVAIFASDNTATEAGLTTGSLVVSRTGPVGWPNLTVNFTVGGTATPGSDYQTLGTSVTIPSGQTSTTLTVTPIDDTIGETNETVTVTLSSGAAYIIGNSSASVTIISDDAFPVVSIVTSASPATEAGLVPGTFTVSRTGPTTEALMVGFTVSGTATAGSDYQSLSNSVTIPSGQASATLTVTPIDDTVGENDETITVTLVSGANYTLGTSAATVTLVSNDLPVVTVVTSDATATEAGLTTGAFTISRTQPTTAALPVSFTVGGTATPGSDYQTLPASVTIPVGQAFTTLTVTPINDVEEEANETIIATLVAGTGYTIGTSNTATVTIVSDDLYGSLQFSAATYSRSENGGTATITVTRTGGTTGAVGATVSTSNGTATAGSDYTTVNQVVSFGSGDAANKTVSIPILDDTTFEGNETVLLSLISPTGGAKLGSQTLATLTIVENDPVPPLAINAIAYGDGTLTCRVNGTPTPCAGPFALNTLVTVTAAPEAGFRLTDWGGACDGTPSTSLSCAVTMNTAKSVIATFRALPVKRPPPARTPPPVRQ